MTSFADGTILTATNLNNAIDAKLALSGGTMTGAINSLTTSGSVTLSPANNPVTISPTGTGTVTINPATAGTMDRVAIGGTTPLTGAFTTLSATGAASFTGAVTFNTAPASFLNQGRFSRVSSTSAQFVPYNGAMIKINGLHYLIPSAGIAGLGNTASCFVGGVAAQALAASTFYYVYAFLNSGTVTADFTVTTHATSATAGNIGTEIKSGDDTRTLIGAVFTDVSNHLVDTDASRTVLSWVNRQKKRVQNSFTAARSTASATFVEVNSEIRCNFIIWADDALTISANGGVGNSAGNVSPTGIGIDGTTQGAGVFMVGTSQSAIGLSETRTGISEGALHFATLVGASSGGGTTTWSNSGIAGGAFPTLSGFITG